MWKWRLFCFVENESLDLQKGNSSSPALPDLGSQLPPHPRLQRLCGACAWVADERWAVNTSQRRIKKKYYFLRKTLAKQFMIGDNKCIRTILGPIVLSILDKQNICIIELFQSDFLNLQMLNIFETELKDNLAIYGCQPA